MDHPRRGDQEFDFTRQLKDEKDIGNSMHINLGVIDNQMTRSRTSSDAFVFGSEGTAPCESPNGNDGLPPDVSRKQRHNLREQRRIMRIGNQFEQLKKKLESVGFISNKKDKHSILQATIEYISALERDAHAAGLPTPLPRPPSSSSSSTSSGPLDIIHTGKENAIAMPNKMQLNPSSSTATHLMDDMHSTNGPPMEYSMWTMPQAPPPVQCVPEMVFDSSASFRYVFLHSSIPTLITRLDCAIVDANYLFYDFFNISPDDLRMHSLYSICMSSDVPKMQNIITKILSCELNTGHSRLAIVCGVERQVFASVSIVRDHAGQAVNIHCSLLPMA